MFDASSCKPSKGKEQKICTKITKKIVIFKARRTKTSPNSFAGSLHHRRRELREPRVDIIVPIPSVFQVSKGKGNWENGISFPKNRDFRARSRLEMSSYRRHSREKYQNFPGKYFSMSLYERHQGFGMEGLALFPSSFFLVHFL